MKKYTSLTILIFIAFTAFAQKQTYWWQFGEHAGLNFNKDTVVVVESSLFSTAGSASISDATGQLLFSTDGGQIFNKTDTMLNGNDIGGNNQSTQSSIIVAVPGQTGIYYVFTTDSLAGPKGFRYSKVDMSLDGGKGGVTVKSIPLLSVCDEKISAVGAPDGGYWVMAHEWPGDGFFAYKISHEGLDTTPIISHVGLVHSDSTVNTSLGQMKFSPDGKKLALAIGYQGVYQVFDFNGVTGKLSNAVTISGNYHSYGVEFSPNSKLLYTSYHNSVDALEQYDLSSGNEALINASKATIANSGDQFRSLQLAPNGKIYVAAAFTTHIDVINAPDVAGLNCNFQTSAINLDPHTSGIVHCLLGLPNFVTSYFRGKPVTAFITPDTAICQSTCINFIDQSLNNVDSWEWHFASALPDTSGLQNPESICYLNPGIFSVTLITGSKGSFDTLKLDSIIHVYPNPTVTIHHLFDTLYASNGSTFQWYNNGIVLEGATDSSYLADSAGSYTVLITDKRGCPAMSDPYIVVGINNILADKISVFPNPLSDGYWELSVTDALIGKEASISNNSGQILWSGQITKPKAQIPLNAPPGIYLLRIANEGYTITKKLIRL